jgi:hypothetical protein
VGNVDVERNEWDAVEKNPRVFDADPKMHDAITQKEWGCTTRTELRRELQS